MSKTHVSCPSCGSTYPLEAGLNDADAKRFAALMGTLPPSVAKLIPHYLNLFKPRKSGMTWIRRLALLEEIAPQITAATVTREGMTRPAPAQYWIVAIESMISSTTLSKPIKSNGYLLDVVTSESEKAAARGEQKTIEAQRAGQRGHGQTPSANSVQAANIRNDIKQLKAMQYAARDDSQQKQKLQQQIDDKEAELTQLTES